VQQHLYSAIQRYAWRKNWISIVHLAHPRREDFQSDGAHPSAQGQMRIAGQILRLAACQAGEDGNGLQHPL